MEYTYGHFFDINLLERTQSPLSERARAIWGDGINAIKTNEMEKKNVSKEDWQQLPPETVLDQTSIEMWQNTLKEVSEAEAQDDAPS